MKLKTTIVITLVTIFMLLFSASAASAKVMWGKTELKKGQIGKITVTKPINLWERDANNKLKFSRVLNPGEEYRVYRYDNLHGGQYGLGGGMYITKMPTYIKYETPSKAKLALLEKESTKVPPKYQNRSWEGKWYRNIHNEPAVLEITRHKGNTFQFDLNASSGGNVGGTKGTAVIDEEGLIAIQTTNDDGGRCMIEIHHWQDRLAVIEGGECLSGMGVFLDGEYEKKVTQDDLVSLLVLDKYSDKLLRSVVGSDYEMFVNTVQFSENLTDLDEMKASVWSNWVRGLNGFQNSIIMIAPFDKVYAAVIDPDKNVINYYTNDSSYKKQLPRTIQSWKNNLGVEYKVINK